MVCGPDLRENSEHWQTDMTVCVHLVSGRVLVYSRGGSLYIPTSNAKEINRTTGNIPIKRRLPRRTEFVCGFKVLLNGWSTMTWRQQMKFLSLEKDWTLAILRLILLPNIAVEVHFRTSCYEGLLKLKLKGFSSSGRLELVSGHLGEGLLELLGDPLQLLLLAHQLVLQSVNLNREFLFQNQYICVCRCNSDFSF